MDRKEYLLELVNELSEEEFSRVVNFATEIKETSERNADEQPPVAFWDNDDKIWNEISR